MNSISWRVLLLILCLAASFCISLQCANGEDVVVNFPNQMTVTGTVTAEIQPDLQYLPDDFPDDPAVQTGFNTQTNGGSLSNTPSGFSSRLNLSYLIFDDQQITDSANVTFSGIADPQHFNTLSYTSNVTFRLFKCHFDWDSFFNDLNTVFFGQAGIQSSDLLLHAPSFSRPSGVDYSYTYTFPFTNQQITLKIPFSWFARGGQFYSVAQLIYYLSRWTMDMALVWSMIWIVFKYQ